MNKQEQIKELPVIVEERVNNAVRKLVRLCGGNYYAEQYIRQICWEIAWDTADAIVIEENA